MGVDAADFDGDGWQDLFVANVDQEMFSLYKNMKNETFSDVAFKNQVAQATRLLSGWGLRFFDYDNDGWLDLFLANGHPDDMIDNYSQQVKYKEPLLLFHNENGQLRNVSAEAGPAFTKSFPARGLAIGDYNNDGRVDVLIGNNGGPPVLLHNNAGAGNHWLGVKLEGVKCNRDAVGARITWSAGGVTRSRVKNGGGSYLSAHDPREVLGMGRRRRSNGWKFVGRNRAAEPSDSPACRGPLHHHRRGQGNTGVKLRQLIPLPFHVHAAGAENGFTGAGAQAGSVSVCEATGATSKAPAILLSRTVSSPAL